MPPQKRSQQRNRSRNQQRPPQRNRPGNPQRAAQQRPAGGPARQGPGRSFYTPGGTPFRHAVERRSAPFLVLLTRAPRVVMMLLPLALLLLGLFLPLAIGLVALALFLLFTGWLAYLSWPNADTRAKTIRVLMFVLVIALIAVRVARA